MQPLEKSLRNKLEKAVKEARDVAEAAARAALDQMGVGDASAPSFLTEEVRELRRKLRAHGRQMGDSINGGKTQTFERLIEEVAYEHWHRMLFARFLAENELLMYPDPISPIAVTLDECEELAADEGAANGWELAARFATRMLPQIFRIDSPVFQLTLPPEHQQKLEGLVGGLPKEVFSASDSLGWVYQFWQSKRKDEVNASEVKIGARELPAVTQLFTEPYMVAFLLDNSLGAWWAGRRIKAQGGGLKAESEEELRQALSIPGVPLEYLRFVRQEDGTWTPAAGTFDGWPEHLSELKTLDPCCGSGHFLVSALLMLVPMRMELEELSEREAVDKIFSENIHGLEIDQRCVELAAFALALTAWRYPNAGGYRQLPEIQVACTGLSVKAAKEEWTQLALNKHNLRIALDWMYDTFKDAPVLGSLIDPSRSSAAKIVSWDELSKTVEQALSSEQSDAQREASVVAHGLARAAIMLASNYHWIITNVPYLGRGSQEEILKDFCDANYPEGKRDLAFSFMQRLVSFQHDFGTVSAVCPQSWLFQPQLNAFRRWVLENNSISTVVGLGPGAFETISGEVVNIALIISHKSNIDDYASYNALDLNDVSKLRDKALLLQSRPFRSVAIRGVRGDGSNRFVLSQTSLSSNKVGDFTRSIEGLSTGDKDRFIFKFWELESIDSEIWSLYQNSPSSSTAYDGLSELLRWEQGSGVLSKYPSARIQGHEAWGKKGILSCKMGTIRSAIYLGGLYDKTCVALTPTIDSALGSLFTFAQTEEYHAAVRTLDARLCVATSVFESIPLEIDDDIFSLPEPYSNDSTQWIFHGHPAQCVEPLQVAVARLLGYRWPAELDPEMELSAEARAMLKESEKLLPLADEDGIVCIPAIRGEMKAEDRLENLLAAAYGSEWSSNKRSELLAQADHAGKTLDTWLREKFFAQHCKVFQNRPFIWHIWDGLRDGFAALVNYHKLDYKNLETLIYTYLGDWISRQKQDITTGIDGAQEKLAAAEALKKKLELILKGESPYDIFVRWKSIEKQPVGWNPDINDGVRLNIRPFLSVPDVGKRGAGVLRDKPNIKWDKDRGKDVESAPWYGLGPEYGGKEGDRINDHHLSLAEKEAARQQV